MAFVYIAYTLGYFPRCYQMPVHLAERHGQQSSGSQSCQSRWCSTPRIYGTEKALCPKVGASRIRISVQSNHGTRTSSFSCRKGTSDTLHIYPKQPASVSSACHPGFVAMVGCSSYTFKIPIHKVIPTALIVPREVRLNQEDTRWKGSEWRNVSPNGL
jgi:hypothetical protein